MQEVATNPHLRIANKLAKTSISVIAVKTSISVITV